MIIGTLLLVNSCQTKTEPEFTGHVAFLASDDLEGREAGTTGEQKAAAYIVEQFQKIGLKPLGDDNTFLQAFDFLASKEVGDRTTLSIDDNQVNNENFYPLNFSGNTTAEGKIIDGGFGIHALELGYDDYAKLTELKNKILLINISSPDGIHPHSKYLDYHNLKERARVAEEKGASGVIFYNIDATAPDPEKHYTQKITSLEIPVTFIKNETSETLAGKNVIITVELVEERRVGHNVIGWIDNGANSFAVLGAHYDHLGYGEGGGSLYRGDDKMIHNGADDNASGTAMVIELAKGVGRSGLINQNYVFILFSGEERGLLGSKYFVDNPTIDLSKIKYMLNMDMVGRVDTTKNAISIMGSGTSPQWDSLLNLQTTPFDLVKSASGVGPSDYTSFYLKDIPVLGFFTGTHSDYHKPGDDSETLNYEGMMQVYQLIFNIVSDLNDFETIAFSKTVDSNARSAPSFTVTLGIIPDYVYEGKGLKIDGVTEGKPGAVAGLQKGDIITRMGELSIDDIYAYMNALSKFKQGEEIEIEILREGIQTVLKTTL
jgi:hypothetical protein